MPRNKGKTRRGGERPPLLGLGRRLAQNEILAESWRILEPGLKMICVLKGVWNVVLGARQMAGAPVHDAEVVVENWVVLNEV